MIQRVYTKLKSEGISGFVGDIYRRIFPYRLKYWPNYLSFFQSRIGLEIGGPSAIFSRNGGMHLCIPIYTVADRIDNCNFGNNTVWEGSIYEGENFIFNKKKAPGRQYIADSRNLHLISDSSYDFILSCHCIEHLANPLQDLTEWIRVLKKNGTLLIVFPHKDGTFDHRRPVTLLDHLIQDFENKTDESDLTHLEEILKLHDLDKDPEAGDFELFKERSKRNLENRCLHHHVFDTKLAVDVINYIGLKILAVELFLPYHIAIIAKKTDKDKILNKDEVLLNNGEILSRSPFHSDHLANH